MDAPTGQITFGPKSQKAIERIRQLKTMERIASASFNIGALAGILGRDPLTTSFNITTTDWETLLKASQVLPSLFTRSACIEAGVLANDYSLPNTERRFWQGILASCSTH